MQNVTGEERRVVLSALLIDRGTPDSEFKCENYAPPAKRAEESLAVTV